MKKPFLFMFGYLFVSFIAIPFVAPRVMHAQDHVVAPADLQKDLSSSSATRQNNERRLDEFVSSPQAQRALKTGHIDGGQVRDAISQLSDEDLARLSARSEKARNDFAAGRLSDRDLIIILVAIAALILIIVAVR